jgi:syntaxin-binding protein 1
LRGKHIADVIQTLSNKIREIVDSSSGSALSKSAKANGKALSLNQMAKALKALPEYREIMSKLSQHMQIAHQCMDAFGSQGLLELSELEQRLATGKTDEGKSPKLKQLLGMTVEEFRKQPNSLMRLRLMAIVIVSQRGLGSESDLQKLLGEASLSSKELSALRNLEKLGCPLVQRKSADTKGKLVGFLKSKGVETFTQAESDSEYSSSRYVCLLKPILEQAAAGKLSVDQYPSVMPLPDAEAVLGQSASGAAKSVRKAGTASSKWQSQSTASNASVKKKTSYSGRQIVFMAGGMCYSELRSAREVMNASGTEIVVGGTRFITPKDFLIDLNNLG